ncbi:UV excision repair protein rad23 [Lecanicillium sp. MT-2017a]|nr:UV excision repair protein rad23 [Lecanicillium sp. MT-2017a]
MSRSGFIVGTSILLTVALISQITFMVIHFKSSRSATAGGVQKFLNKDLGAWSPSSYVKSIRYSQTLPRTSDSEDKSSIQLQDSPPSMRSKFTVPGGLKVTIPQAIRSTSSRTRLLPTKETRRPLSLDSYTYAGSVQESFDNWDTSSVDFHNRQVVMEVASSPLSPLSRVHNLDTIPASPRGSRSPSPGNPLDLKAPRIPQRSRSYSPATGRRPNTDSIPASPSELHIHPLFRSDSPISPPILSAGTSVIASPDAGQILPHRKSAKSLRQLQSVQSGGLSSPRDVIKPSKSFESASNISTTATAPQQERKMTPPVPDWVLNSARGPPVPRLSDERKMRPELGASSTE